ncbi:hypothetical protein FOZ60_001976 [Perkinsus olseni]|uniref:Uncharacterized protein n=1 Tax=Perkinsus olseni TaxID=32597 RepID=A0A7J6NZ91_PEROL|nr:hypothetical protein FOZ60_001976 [Perkinsus olseni]
MQLLNFMFTHLSPLFSITLDTSSFGKLLIGGPCGSSRSYQSMAELSTERNSNSRNSSHTALSQSTRDSPMIGLLLFWQQQVRFIHLPWTSFSEPDQLRSKPICPRRPEATHCGLPLGCGISGEIEAKLYPETSPS